MDPCVTKFASVSVHHFHFSVQNSLSSRAERGYKTYFLHRCKDLLYPSLKASKRRQGCFSVPPGKEWACFSLSLFRHCGTGCARLDDMVPSCHPVQYTIHHLADRSSLSQPNPGNNSFQENAETYLSWFTYPPPHRVFKYFPHCLISDR